MRIELLYAPGCPHWRETREMLRRLVRRLDLSVEIQEHAGDYPSPTVLVDGTDVMGEPTTQGPACRLDLPTEQRLLAALSSA